MTNLLIGVSCHGIECGKCAYNDWHSCWLFWDQLEPTELGGDPPLRCKECLDAEDAARPIIVASGPVA